MSDITYRLVKKERDEVEAELAQLKLLAAYELAPAPEAAGGRYPNLLAYLQRGQSSRLQGKHLVEAIQAMEIRFEVISERFAVENEAREAEFAALDANPIPLAVNP